jgi:hypothetical protein
MADLNTVEDNTMRRRLFKGVGVAGFVVAGVLGGALSADGQQVRDRDRLPLEPMPNRGAAVAPIMEGWYDNADGTFTISFGYFNANVDTVRVGVEASVMEPAEYSGMQPTTFLPGRHQGVFTVTIPESFRENDVWWRIHNPTGMVTENPGRVTSAFYESDLNPRPHGSEPPLLWFDEEEGEAGAGRGPMGVTDPVVHSARVGLPFTLTVHVRDPSERDRSDPRLRDGIDTMVQWFEHRSPTPVRWERHPSTPEGEEDREFRQALIPEEGGTFVVNVVFAAPGEYMFRVRADNFRAPDSSAGDQCCWSNGFVRVNVTE